MIVTMIPVRVMQVTIDQIIDMVAVGDCFVTTTGTVNVIGIVTAAVVRRRACVRIRLVDLQHMFFDLSVVANMM